MNNNFDGLMLVLGVVGTAIAIYFIPAMVGKGRDINSGGALFLVNLLFGWTLIGWFICIIWAVAGATKSQDKYYRLQAASAEGALNPNDPAFREAYAKERARLDHLAAMESPNSRPPT